MEKVILLKEGKGSYGEARVLEVGLAIVMRQSHHQGGVSLKASQGRVSADGLDLDLPFSNRHALKHSVPCLHAHDGSLGLGQGLRIRISN